MGGNQETQQWHENQQQARENTPKPGETQEFMENSSFLEWPKDFDVPDGVGIYIIIYIYNNNKHNNDIVIIIIYIS